MGRGALDDGLAVLAEDAGVGVGSGRARRGCSPPQVGIRRLAKPRLTMLMNFRESKGGTMSMRGTWWRKSGVVVR